MNRILVICALFSVCSLAACQKSSLYGSVQYDAQAKVDDSIISQYIRGHGLTKLAKHVQNNDTIGVYYVVLDPGSGAAPLFTNSTSVTVGDTCRVLTTGQLVFKTNIFHPSYVLGQVILGLQLGIPEANINGEVRLLVPSRYAYGPVAHPELASDSLPGGLRANAVLDFRIRLYNVTN